AALGVRLAAGVTALIGGAGFLLYLLTVAGYYLWIGAETARRAEILAREAELRALKAQLNPHFLFNSLNSISALTATDPARAREMCVLLGDFLRRTLRLGERRGVPLADELDLTRAYLAVEQIRFGPRLRFEENIAPGALATEVPPLLLQPLVENAVVHGIAQLLEGGWIRLDAAWTGDGLRLCVCNPYDPEALDALSPRPGSGGLGLANVRNRLEARFGAAASIETAATNGQFTVTIMLPQEVPA
ncbi:MAG TPA: histidine kinase, partial [Terriglobales bacterium]|nr:histidine kinase [Terriglobales bacterium]